MSFIETILWGVCVRERERERERDREGGREGGREKMSLFKCLCFEVFVSWSHQGVFKCL